jgi:CubicO group peptidase (beta-lactamase class C family)
MFTCALGIAAVALASVQPVATSAATAQSAPWRDSVDKVFAPWATRQSPGCAVGIYKDGAIAYERGYGMADLEHDVPITPDTPFYVGSVSKQFTAFAAALLIQQGKAGPDDSIRKYFPELADYANAITVRHLVHHTSGLRDFYTLLSIAGRRQDELYDNFAVLRMAARQKELNFPPGTDYLYSNTGYALLASLIGRAAGTTFSAFADANIFKPLGMSSSHVHDDDARLVKGRAYGYSGAMGALRLDASTAERVGAGGVYSTIRDLIKWDENFYTGKVGGRALIDQVQTPGSLSDGKPLTYAWGLQIGRYRGLPIVEHGGSLVGYRAHLMRFPDQHVSVACLCNLASTVPGALARQVADLVLATTFKEPATAPGQPGAGPGRGGAPTSPTPQSATASPLADFAGRYYSDETDGIFTITVKDGGLFVQRETDATPALLVRGAADEFRFGGMTVRFVRGADRMVQALLVDAGRVRGIRFDRRKP